MRPTHAALLSVAILLIQAAGSAACGKKKTDQTDQPAAAASEPAPPRIDPRLAPDPPAGTASRTGEAPPADAVGPSPHRSMPPVPATGGGRTPEKTDAGRVVLGPMTGAVPDSWKVRPTTSAMRAAEWTIPGPEGDAELVVYHFGAAGAGSVEANLDRWVGQFEEPAGGKAKPRTEKKVVAGMPVTLVEVTGHYVAAVMPGAAEKQDKPNHTLLGAIVETSAGPYYFKFVGPRATAEAARKDFHAFIESLAPSGK